MELHEQGARLTRGEATDLLSILHLGVASVVPDDEDELVQRSWTRMIENVAQDMGMFSPDQQNDIEVEAGTLRIIGFVGSAALLHREAVIRAFCTQFDGCTTNYYPSFEPKALDILEDLSVLVDRTAEDLGLMQ